MSGVAVAEQSEVLPGFWRGRRVLVTGHTGFKGGWLSLWLTELGARVQGYSLLPNTTSTFFEAVDLAARVEHCIGDVRGSVGLHKVVQEFRPELIFHLAAQPLVREAYEDPLYTYATNVMGTVHLLEAVRAVDTVRVVVNVTSDKCYEAAQEPPYRESDRLGGKDPYASSKACSELVASAYRQSFFRNDRVDGPEACVLTARAGNVLGGGDWAEDRLIPDAVRAFSAGRTLRIRHPGYTRPWQHVTDCLAGYLILAQAAWSDSTLAGAWNFGPAFDEVPKVIEVVRRFARAWGGEPAFEETDVQDDHREEAQRLTLDSEKARRRLGWKPRLTLTETLQVTADWYRAYYEGADPNSLWELTLRQIDRSWGIGEPAAAGPRIT